MAIEKEILTWRLSDAIATISEPSTDPPHHATYRCKDQHVPQRDQYIFGAQAENRLRHDIQTNCCDR